MEINFSQVKVIVTRLRRILKCITRQRIVPFKKSKQIIKFSKSRATTPIPTVIFILLATGSEFAM